MFSGAARREWFIQPCYMGQLLCQKNSYCSAFFCCSGLVNEKVYFLSYFCTKYSNSTEISMPVKDDDMVLSM